MDDAARGYIREQGFGEYFVHRTGHSIGRDVHGSGANMDNLETHDERRRDPVDLFFDRAGGVFAGVRDTVGGECVCRGDRGVRYRRYSAEIGPYLRRGSCFAGWLRWRRRSEGDLPVSADLEARLRERGYQERFLPVQAEVLEPTAEESKRGWMLYRRDRNFEVLPNSRPAPNERAAAVRITAAQGEMESEPFAVYALRDVGGVKAEAAVSAQGVSAWLRDAVKVEDVLFHPVQYTASRTRQQDEVRGASGKTYLRYPVFVRPPGQYAVPAQSSRLYWVTATVHENARPGVYRAAITLADADGNRSGAAVGSGGVALPVDGAERSEVRGVL